MDFLKVRQIAEEALALQNKNAMDEALKDIVFICAEAQAQASIADCEMHEAENNESEEPLLGSETQPEAENNQANSVVDLKAEDQSAPASSDDELTQVSEISNEVKLEVNQESEK